MNALLRAGVAALALLLLAACSGTRIAYNNADWLLRWRATSYLDVHGEQAEKLERGIAALLDWHRANALPRYARLTEEFGTRVARGLSRADLVWGYDAILEEARETLRAAANESAELLDSLNEAQIAHLESRISEDNRKFAEEYLAGSPRERRERRLRRNVERLEDWLGTLNDAQIERVKRYSDLAPLADEYRDQDRRRRQTELLAMVRAREAGRRLADWAQGWNLGRDPAYEAAAQAHLKELLDMLLDLDRMMTPRQRERVVARLRELSGDFSQLAAQGVKGSPR